MSFAPMVSRIRSRPRFGFCFFRGVQHVLQLRDLTLYVAGATAGQRTIAGALAAEKAGVDGRAGAGKRQEGHGHLRILDRDRERGAELVAVERAVAGRGHPARAGARPCGDNVAARAARRVVAGLQPLKARAARAEVFARTAAEEAAEAIAVVGERDGAVGIAFAGGDGVADARDEKIAHADFGGDAVDALVRLNDAGRSDRRLTVAKPHADLVGAGRAHGLRRDGAVVKTPVAGRACGHGPGELDHDAVIFRGEIVLAVAVALAGLRQLAGAVDAELVEHVLGPAAAAGVLGELLLGGEDAAGAVGGDMPLEVGVVAEQAEAVVHLPHDLRGGAGSGRRQGRRIDRLRGCPV